MSNAHSRGLNSSGHSRFMRRLRPAYKRKRPTYRVAVNHFVDQGHLVEGQHDQVDEGAQRPQIADLVSTEIRFVRLTREPNGSKSLIWLSKRNSSVRLVRELNCSRSPI